MMRPLALSFPCLFLAGCVTVPLTHRPDDNLIVEQIERIDEFSPVPVLRDREASDPEIRKVTSRRTLVTSSADSSSRRSHGQANRRADRHAQTRWGNRISPSPPGEDSPDWAGIVQAIGPSGKKAARTTARFASSTYSRGRGWVSAAARATTARFGGSRSAAAPAGEYMVAARPGQVGRGGVCWPCSGKVSRGFNPAINHKGIDICAPEGTPVLAARGGRVVYSGKKLSGYGNVVILDHGGGFATVYAHNSRNLVSDGDHVAQGQQIALVGQTGDASTPHCHFEMRFNTEPVDPRPYLP